MQDGTQEEAHLAAGGAAALDEVAEPPRSAGLRPRDLITRSNLRGAVALFGDWFLIISAAAFSIWADHILAYLFSVCVIGTIQFSLRETVLHEAVHYNLFRTRVLNEWSQVLHAWPFFYDVNEYRRAHFAHHRDLMGPGDPIPDAYYRAGYQNRKRGLWWLWGLRPLLGYAGLTYIVQFARPTPIRILTLIAMLAGAWGLGRVEGLKILGLYWFVPLLTINACHDHWFGITDHLHVSRSRSRSYTSWLWNFFHHGIGYHQVHHMYPAIPWYNLKKAHEAFCPPDAELSRNLLETYRQITSPEGALPIRPENPTRGFLKKAMDVMNWYPSRSEQPR
ncbi:fatty acid desaturase family protein [Hyalangium gracile]|uniref:fatty acid desaturase family protein n=1 Tax=Hyalangium gracile TaxID=394092 RepID=UPI001CCB9A51|nr:fatty acid desaturase [Hyalangium gracile]